MGLMMKNVKTMIAIAGLSVLSINTAQAEQFYGFANVSVNYLDWTGGTTERSGKTDFIYLEAEGGAGYDWGDVYGNSRCLLPAR